MSDTPKPVAIEDSGSTGLGRLSLVWVIPLVALIAALSIAWQSYRDQGPVITIEFAKGAGIAARETEVRYRDVKVGVVEKVHFSEGLSSVLAEVRLEKEVAPYVDSGASFWIVQPELTARGVSGLDTVLSGVFIEGTWDQQIGTPQARFQGLETAPLFRSGKEGLQIALRTVPGGVMTDNTPILYRGIEVGLVGTASISTEGNFAIAEAIIYEPHGRLITPSTRFWDTSGFSVSIGASGAEIDFSSLASLVSGGITFDTFVSGGTRVADGTIFEVFPSEASARNSVFNASEVDVLELRVIFDENISGLALGAPVELSGLRIGSVENLSGIIDRDIFGDSRVRLSVVLGIQPARLGLPDEVSAESALLFLRERVERGLRARLASGNLLTGGLKIELVEVDDAPPDQIVMADDSIPTLPSTQSDISDAAATVEGVFTRINSLPIEELLQSAIGFLEGARNFVGSEELRETPQEVRALLADIRAVVQSGAVQEIPVTLNAALGRLEAILGQVEEAQAITRLTAAMDAATAAAQSVGESVDGVPALLERLTEVTANAAALPLQELTEQATGVLSAAQELISAPETRELPLSLSQALEELALTLAELREGGAVTNVNATLASAREAADAVALSSRDLPQLVNRITEVFDRASATIEGYNRGDVLSRDAQAALQDISRAAEAITSLVRLLERNPSALIRGR